MDSNNQLFKKPNEVVSLYLDFLSCFSDDALYPWDTFINMPFDIVKEIISQKSKRNAKRIEEMEKAKSDAGKNLRQSDHRRPGN